uniref:AlNc14C9G1211 protein n=1 Tax=Albugo laibachii Nc14 TaxID=890382 RepID=F0W2G0_9STRA|nr:AlNc14C9G1211 [Albugo laibachii Nc14]|eukprot:CCA15246.1 AlNc14C9G1211 [Albugo laibachii Nc14]
MHYDRPKLKGKEHTQTAFLQVGNKSTKIHTGHKVNWMLRILMLLLQYMLTRARVSLEHHVCPHCLLACSFTSRYHSPRSQLTTYSHKNTVHESAKLSINKLCQSLSYTHVLFPYSNPRSHSQLPLKLTFAIINQPKTSH